MIVINGISSIDMTDRQPQEEAQEAVEVVQDASSNAVSREEHNKLLERLQALETFNDEEAVTQDELHDLDNKVEDIARRMFGGSDLLDAEGCALETEPSLLDRISVVETQINEMRVDEDMEKDGEKRSKRFYVVLRGKYDYEKQEFISGMCDHVEEHDAVVKGAHKAKSVVRDSYESAARYYEENIDAVEAENATKKNPEGVHSPVWYLVCPKEGRAVSFIYPTFEEAQVKVKGSNVHGLKKFSTYLDANNELNRLLRS